MAETQTVTKDDVAQVPAEVVAGDGKEKKKRNRKPRKPIEVPDPSKFEGPAKEQIITVLEVSKAFVDAIKAANSVQPRALNGVKRGVNQAITKHLRSLRTDPVEKKKKKLEAQIAKATAALNELLKEASDE